ncbi:MAG: caspase family protein [Desulfobacteraceae bacterium]|uniref:Caspase family protein n=1 Tax=Candidatus Desulfaltia bathyphila TaxID=2841697 RepID=A0A8J6N6G1_9BACT|nr:caspase family protein [Candidatus Desulfaltia bathyphila]MBL7196386.1 caspase family protein [Desulfobacterales bacterium]
MSPIAQAIKEGDINAARDFLNKGANANEEVDCAGLTDLAFYSPLLICAAGYGNNDAIKLLLDKGVDINIKSAAGWTALSYAAYQGKSKTAQLLIDRGADVDVAAALLESGATKFPNSSSFPYIDYKLALKLLGKYTKKPELVPPVKVSSVNTNEPPSSSFIKSDIDELPAVLGKTTKNSYAIVIGIENYRQKLPKADFATGDAKLVTEYLTKVIGYPEENVITLTNEYASKSDFEKYIEEWLPKNIEPDSSVFIYYSGHGAPNPKTGDAFLVPYDGDPNFIEKTGYPLKKLYENLSKLQAKEIIVALDSCFSGAGGRSVLAQGSRPLVMNLQTTLTPAKNMIIMAASSGNEISSTYNDKGHGLFTYFLLKGIKGEADLNEDGKIQVEELYQYLKPQVQKIARKMYNNEQTPQLIAPADALLKIFLWNN